jgi:hypothetical protein
VTARQAATRARASRKAAGALRRESAKKLLRSPGSDQVDRAAIAQMGIESLQPQFGSLGWVEAQKAGDHQLEEIHTLGIGEIDTATLPPAGHLSGTYSKQIGQAPLRAKVMTQSGDLLCGLDRHRYQS